MAAQFDLTTNDDTILSKIFDPESTPGVHLMIDNQLPRDPHIDDVTLSTIQSQEKTIVSSVEGILQDDQNTEIGQKAKLCNAYSQLSSLIDTYPQAASVRNNRAQLARMILGPDLIGELKTSEATGACLPTVQSLLQDLDKAIELASPSNISQAVSPFQCHLLGQAYTQRAALFHAASKDPNLMARFRNLGTMFSNWDVNDFEEAASRDFFMGGRYGNEIGKALAVHTNPTAKLCGQMVQEAMKREMAIGSSAA